ncbi:MAG: glycosyltransferase family 4 protein, partial [Sphingomonadales bacterium]|nr:glycosyltransferase family 4 protein [Sphingomonadales bacterium]
MQRDAFEIRDFPSLEPLQSESDKCLSVLIATEEIVGPVRNGGIASTYYHLARGLAAQGHEVTVLYLKGREVENATPEHWVGEYARFGIHFVPLPEPDEPLAGASPRWQRRWLSFYRWLRANDRFDVVHSSEWRGGAFYCLQAKRMGLAFRDTLFVIKTSSPYIWNRHYQLQLVESPDLLAASFAEQKCVEWADMVVGGSAHLLSFMEHVGYRLPEGRTYVQPNIVDFSEVQVEDKRPAREIGDVVKTRELVFFGRLEGRKGLDLFVGALDALVARGARIDKVTFLGKEGQKLGGGDGITPLELINRHRPGWPFEVDIVTDRDQPEALSLMCSRDMIAVMPSLIENSTMAVYETLVHRIPFVASAVGGTPELIDPADHEATLVPPQAEALADRLADILENGQPIARPAFDNDRNLASWYGFHRHIAEAGAAALMPPAPPEDAGATLCLVRFARDAQAMEAALSQASDGAPGFDAIRIYSPVAVDAVHKALAARLANASVTVIEQFGGTIGRCFDRALDESNADILVYDMDGLRFSQDAADAIR